MLDAEQPQPARVLARVHDYDGLVAALRAWIDEIGTSYRAIDGVSGLADGYCSKLFSPLPLKSLNKLSLGCVLQALGLRLDLTVDVEQLAKVRHRLPPQDPRGAGPARCSRERATARMRPLKGQAWRGNAGWSKVMNARKMLLTTPMQRSESARHAATIRWARGQASGRHG
jgi:hypothetical protein